MSTAGMVATPRLKMTRYLAICLALLAPTSLSSKAGGSAAPGSGGSSSVEDADSGLPEDCKRVTFQDGSDQKRYVSKERMKECEALRLAQQQKHAEKAEKSGGKSASVEPEETVKNAGDPSVEKQDEDKKATGEDGNAAGQTASADPSSSEETGGSAEKEKLESPEGQATKQQTSPEDKESPKMLPPGRTPLRGTEAEEVEGLRAPVWEAALFEDMTTGRGFDHAHRFKVLQERVHELSIDVHKSFLTVAFIMSVAARVDRVIVRIPDGYGLVFPDISKGGEEDESEKSKEYPRRDGASGVEAVPEDGGDNKNSGDHESSGEARARPELQAKVIIDAYKKCSIHTVEEMRAEMRNYATEIAQLEGEEVAKAMATPPAEEGAKPESGDAIAASSAAESESKTASKEENEGDSSPSGGEPDQKKPTIQSESEKSTTASVLLQRITKIQGLSAQAPHAIPVTNPATGPLSAQKKDETLDLEVAAPIKPNGGVDEATANGSSSEQDEEEVMRWVPVAPLPIAECHVKRSPASSKDGAAGGGAIILDLRLASPICPFRPEILKSKTPEADAENAEIQADAEKAESPDYEKSENNVPCVEPSRISVKKHITKQGEEAIKKLNGKVEGPQHEEKVEDEEQDTSSFSSISKEEVKSHDQSSSPSPSQHTPTGDDDEDTNVLDRDEIELEARAQEEIDSALFAVEVNIRRRFAIEFALDLSKATPPAEMESMDQNRDFRVTVVTENPRSGYDKKSSKVEREALPLPTEVVTSTIHQRGPLPLFELPPSVPEKKSEEEEANTEESKDAGNTNMADGTSSTSGDTLTTEGDAKSTGEENGVAAPDDENKAKTQGDVVEGEQNQAGQSQDDHSSFSKSAFRRQKIRHDSDKTVQAIMRYMKRHDPADPDCAYSQWAEWPCNTECGGGIRVRTRKQLLFGCPTSEMLEEFVPCNTYPCPASLLGCAVTAIGGAPAPLSGPTDQENPMEASSSTSVTDFEDKTSGGSSEIRSASVEEKSGRKTSVDNSAHTDTSAESFLQINKAEDAKEQRAATVKTASQESPSVDGKAEQIASSSPPDEGQTGSSNSKSKSRQKGEQEDTSPSPSTSAATSSAPGAKTTSNGGEEHLPLCSAANGLKGVRGYRNQMKGPNCPDYMDFGFERQEPCTGPAWKGTNGVEPDSHGAGPSSEIRSRGTTDKRFDGKGCVYAVDQDHEPVWTPVGSCSELCGSGIQYFFRPLAYKRPGQKCDPIVEKYERCIGVASGMYGDRHRCTRELMALTQRGGSRANYLYDLELPKSVGPNAISSPRVLDSVTLVFAVKRPGSILEVHLPPGYSFLRRMDLFEDRETGSNCPREMIRNHNLPVRRIPSHAGRCRIEGTKLRLEFLKKGAMQQSETRKDLIPDADQSQPQVLAELQSSSEEAATLNTAVDDPSTPTEAAGQLINGHDDGKQEGQAPQSPTREGDTTVPRPAISTVEEEFLLPLASAPRSICAPARGTKWWRENRNSPLCKKVRDRHMYHLELAVYSPTKCDTGFHPHTEYIGSHLVQHRCRDDPGWWTVKIRRSAAEEGAWELLHTKALQKVSRPLSAISGYRHDPAVTPDSAPFF
ncbi:unnamed protein product [Amoebophrya sp. A25]|nr:unnamed protein product [Amoebophrya sp. A25]|eukprot:GSA25T00005973001.1